MKRSKLLIILLIILIGFIGISACFSGPLLVIDPSGKRLQFPEGTLDNTPFNDFLVPGILLTLVIGLYPLLVMLWLLFPNSVHLRVKSTLQPRWYAAMGVGIAITIFITIQLIIIPARMFLQDVYLIAGLLICTICLLPAVRKYYANEKQPIS